MHKRKALYWSLAVLFGAFVLALSLWGWSRMGLSALLAGTVFC